jgi:hypothetical protein
MAVAQSGIVASRRDFLAGLAASIALCFAPWERFFEGLRALLARTYAASARVVNSTIDSLAGVLKSRYSQRRIYDLLYAETPKFLCSADGVFSRNPAVAR